MPEAGPRCVQCGGARTDPLGPARYACRDCGAVSSTPGPPPPADPPPDPVPALAGLAGTHPPRLHAWLRSRAAAGEPVDLGTGRAAVFARYAEYDRFVSEARTSPRLRARHDRTSDVPLADVPVRMPPFPRVVAQLQARCFDPRATTAALADGLEGAALVAERVGHALRWLATSGREHCWLTPATVKADPAAVRELLAAADPVRAAAGSDALRRALLAALFGTSQGPSLPGLGDRFGTAAVRAALREHLASGARPLRAELLAELDRAAA